MQKAVFFDRDGVINEEVNYLHKIEDFRFVNGTLQSLKYLQNLGYKLFIITNQSGISRGYYSTKDYDILTKWLLEEFKKNGITISQIEFCPHSPADDCNCRKPKTGMIKNILKNHQIDLKSSWLVGDKDSDIKCANNANIKNTIQVKSGHSFDEAKSTATYICQSIKDIPTIIKS